MINYLLGVARLREFFSTPDDLIPDPPPLTGPYLNLTQDAAGNPISRQTWEQLKRDEEAEKASVDRLNRTNRIGYLRMFHRQKLSMS